jgi:hypothetical protein
MNTNSPSTSTRPTLKPSIDARLAIPKIPIVPDVFAPTPIIGDDSPSTSTRKSLPSRHTSLSKRTRDGDVENFPPSVPLKRSRLNDVGGEKAKERVEKAKAEAEVWRSKWLKHFPTLIFHFELGADEGQGKVLMQRILKMNAVSCYDMRRCI